MGWTERQRRLLAEMGLTVWAPPAGSAPVETEVSAQSSSAAQAVPSSAPSSAPPGAREAARTSVAAPSTPSGRAATGAEVDTRPAVPVASMEESPSPSPVDAEWTALREAVAGCRACGLCEGRRQTVFGVGHPQAQLMVVGEAPGEQEDLRGEPFVGPAGQLLDRMLAAIGLTRESSTPDRQVFIANTLKCRPPGNRNPQPEELAACEPFLQRQIALVQPRVILAMGRFAVQALLRSAEPVGRLRGRVHTYEGVPLVVTYHPAYLLRNLPDKARAWEDLCVVADLMGAQAAAAGRL